jgi:hypothetical protein
MSRLRSIAVAIAERLEEIPELSGKIVVWGRGDIESEIDKRMLKTGGLCVVVRLISGKQLSKGKTTARMGGSYTVTLLSVPVLTQKDIKDSDALMDSIISALHGWWPDSIPSNGVVWCEAEALSYPDVPQYDVTLLTLNAPQTN